MTKFFVSLTRYEEQRISTHLAELASMLVQQTLCSELPKPVYCLVSVCLHDLATAEGCYTSGSEIELECIHNPHVNDGHCT